MNDGVDRLIKTVQYHLDSHWVVEFHRTEFSHPEDDDWDAPPIIAFFVRDGLGLDASLIMHGRVKSEDRLGGCMDVWFPDYNTLAVHFCGPRDTTLLYGIYEEAIQIMDGHAPGEGGGVAQCVIGRTVVPFPTILLRTGDRVTVADHKGREYMRFDYQDH